LVMENTNQFGL
jgi:hypothetical protein